MKLPANLAHWAPQLRIFPEEISLTLGGYVRRIAPFIAPLNRAQDAAHGEPNGYDGVARRGIYERLLLSELALADDFADEFVRRAAMGEHLFLNLAQIAPHAKRVSIALFDAGADQLGAPRIAHLAAFILLARRAEAAGAAFLWGVLQDAQQLVLSDDTEASIKILLESRTARDAAENDITKWREKLREVDRMADVWLVGGTNLARFAETGDFSRLLVEESIEPETRELELKIKSASGAEKGIVLELPPPNISTRLLRNPFEAIRTAAYTSEKLDGIVTNFFFDETGSKLFAKLDSQDVLSFPVQNTASVEKMYPSVYRPENGQPYAAVGRLRKAVAFVSKIDEQTVRLEYRKGRFGLREGLYRAPNQEIAFPENENGLLGIYDVRPSGFPYYEAAILDANDNLFLLSQISSDAAENDHAAVGAAQLMATDVLAVAQSGNRFVFVGCEDGVAQHRIVSVSDKIERHSLAPGKVRQAFFGRGEFGGKVCAYRDDNWNWTITNEKAEGAVTLLPKGEVVGAYHDSRLAPSPGLFELMNDRRTVEFAWQAGRRKHVLTAGDEIVKIEFSPRSPILAYQTAGGELILYSLTHRAAIGRYTK